MKKKTLDTKNQESMPLPTIHKLKSSAFSTEILWKFPENSDFICKIPIRKVEKKICRGRRHWWQLSGNFADSTRIILELSRENPGIIQGLSRDYPEIIQGLSKDFPGILPWILWDFHRNCTRLIKELSWNSTGILLMWNFTRILQEFFQEFFKNSVWNFSQKSRWLQLYIINFEWMWKNSQFIYTLN